MHGASDFKLPSFSLYSLIISLFLSALQNSRICDPRHQSDSEMDRNAAKKCFCPSVSIPRTELLLASFTWDNRPCLHFSWVCVHTGPLFVCEPLHYEESKYFSQTTGAFYRANTIMREGNDTKPGLFVSGFQLCSNGTIWHIQRSEIPSHFFIYHNLPNSKTLYLAFNGMQGACWQTDCCAKLQPAAFGILNISFICWFKCFCKELVLLAKVIILQILLIAHSAWTSHPNHVSYYFSKWSFWSLMMNMAFPC